MSKYDNITWGKIKGCAQLSSIIDALANLGIPKESYITDKVIDAYRALGSQTERIGYLISIIVLVDQEELTNKQP